MTGGNRTQPEARDGEAAGRGYLDYDGRAARPATVALEMMARTPIKMDAHGIIWRYTGSHWREANDPWLRRAAFDAGGFSQDMRNKAIDEVKARAFDENFTFGRVADTEVPVANGVLDLLTGTMRPHRAEDHLERVIPHEYRPGATCPRWQQCLIDWFPDSAEPTPGECSDAEALQEFFGYLLLQHARYKKALVVEGPPNTGKSAVVQAARLLVGKAASCQLPLDAMDDPRLRAVLVGKAINVVTEVTEGGLLKDAGFKTLVSAEDPILIDPKFRPSFTYTPICKHVIACNTLPRINDPTGAVYDRILLIRMLRVIRDDEQHKGLVAELEAELSGILNWAIEGARRLLAREGRFNQPAAGRRALDGHRRSAIVDFVEAHMDVADVTARGETVATPLEVIAKAYNASGYSSRKAGQRRVGIELRKAGYPVKPVAFPSGTYGKKRRVLASLVGYKLVPSIEVPDELIVHTDAMTAADDTWVTGRIAGNGYS